MNAVYSLNIVDLMIHNDSYSIIIFNIVLSSSKCMLNDQ